MLFEHIHKLNQLLFEYQKQQTNDHVELLILEQQLQQTTSEFHTLKTSYEKYYETWRELLSEQTGPPRPADPVKFKSSGKKSLLKQQLTCVDPIVSTVEHLITSSEKEMDNMTKLLNTQPEFELSQHVCDSDLTLDRLIEIARNNTINDTQLWIVEFWNCLEKFSRILDQYIHLISRLESRLQQAKTASEASCARQLKFSSEDVKRKQGESIVYIVLLILRVYIITYMKNNNFIIKDIYQEKNKGRIYDMHKKKLDEINSQVSTSLYQYPKLEDQKVMKKLQDKHNLLKTVSKFYNQEAFLEKERVNQHLLLKIMQPLSSKTRSQHNQSRKDPPRGTDNKRISEENRSLANRITNLPPVIDAKKHDKEYKKHISDVMLMQKYHTTRLIEQQDKSTFQLINKFTNNKFSKSKYSNLNFLQTINKTNKFIMFVVQGFDLFGTKHTSFMGKNPPTYQCQFYLDHKLMGKSKPLEFEEFLESVSGFACHDFTSIQVVIEKIKQNEEFIIGEVRYSESYSHININPLKENLVVKVCDDVDGEIKKSISDEQVSVGRLQFKVLQFCYQTNVNVKLQAPSSYAINVKHLTPQPSVKDPEEILSQQLI